tara:strand:- start:48 stop:299 length:252 start_codon:yes stop_codon:yes gene_type:complete
MRKKVDTGVVTCDLCEKIAVEVLNDSALCEIHSGDQRYHQLKRQNIKFKHILSKILIHAAAKAGHEDEFCKISSQATTALWEL